MDYFAIVHKKLRNLRKKEYDIFYAAQANSADYTRALRLNPEDLEVLERAAGPISYYPTLNELGSKGFLKFRATGEDFALVAREVRISNYGDQGSELMVLAICLNNAEINQSLSHGPDLISIVSEGWHKQIMQELTKNTKWLGSDFTEDRCRAPLAAFPPDISKEIKHLW